MLVSRGYPIRPVVVERWPVPVAAGFFTTAELQLFGLHRVLQSVGLAARVK